jgi:hypothetical protein
MINKFFNIKKAPFWTVILSALFISASIYWVVSSSSNNSDNNTADPRGNDVSVIPKCENMDRVKGKLAEQYKQLNIDKIQI